MVHAPWIQIRWIVRNVCNSLCSPILCVLPPPLPLPSTTRSPLPTMQSQLHVVDSSIFTCALLFISITGCCFLTVHLVLPSAFIQYRGLSVLTANLREALSVPGCQYCLTCACMATKSWLELGMTCVCQHV